jgi:D-alanyl-D-alanine carboxypeptidase
MHRIVVAVGLAAVLAGCGGTTPVATPVTTPVTTPVATPSAPVSTPATPTPTTSPPVPTTSAASLLGTVPPAWLGSRPLPRTAAGFGEIRPTPPELRVRRFTLADTVPMLPGTGFASKVVDPAPADVIARSTWARGCPVKATQLAWVRVTFRGFEGARHTGELLVNNRAAEPLVRVFHQLYDDRFPIEEMRITPKAEQNVAPTGDGNDTGSFNCRPVRGATTYSQHAYGLAVDVNPFQNPYLKGDLVLPELASAYANRGWHRPGMILPDGPVVRAFASIGWGWGGSWQSLKDLQHFSANGR